MEENKAVGGSKMYKCIKCIKRMGRRREKIKKRDGMWWVESEKWNEGEGRKGGKNEGQREWGGMEE